MNKKIRKIADFESTRDYLRYVVKTLCERLEIKDIDVYKLNSKEECIKCIESIVKNHNNSQDNKALYREIGDLKEEIATLTNANFEEIKKNKALEKEIGILKNANINLFLNQKSKIQKLSEYLSNIFLFSGIIFIIILAYKII